jgi:hypothetical protein
VADHSIIPNRRAGRTTVFLVGIALLAASAGDPSGSPAAGSAGAPSLAAAAAARATTGPCSESAYRLNGGRFAGVYRWWFTARTVPPGLNERRVERALRRAVRTVTGSRNTCGLADRVVARSSYGGRTTARPDLTARSTCGTPDGRSEVGFGELAAKDIGLTCFWMKNGRTVEADVELNQSYYTWYVRRPATCSRSWSIRVVATHEFGHAFGLDHVSELTDGALTMSPLILPCQRSEATLGLGDVLGLRALY